MRAVAQSQPDPALVERVVEAMRSAGFDPRVNDGATYANGLVDPDIVAGHRRRTSPPDIAAGHRRRAGRPGRARADTH